MAKDGTKKKKLPKSLGGVKIPKELRKGGEKLLAKAQTPEGRAAIAKGVSAIAGAATMMAQAAQAKKAAPQPVKQEAPGAGNPDALSDAIGAGVDLVLGKLFPRR